MNVNDQVRPESPPLGGNAIAVFLLGCLIIGWGCFTVVGNALRTMPDRFWAAVWWQLSFAVGLALIVGFIAYRNRLQGATFADCGLGKRTSNAAIAAGVFCGLLYVSGVYVGILHDPAMKNVNPFAFHWVRLALVPLGIAMATCEEIMMRGFFMNQLDRARAPVWIQILLSGVCSGIYHAMHSMSLVGVGAATFLFSLHALLYVAGGRSLTPSIVAHSMYHVLCAPYLLMYAMTQSFG